MWPCFEVNGLDWQCCLAGNSKTAPRIFIFSIVLGAKYLSYVKSIATLCPHIFCVYYFSLSQCVLLWYIRFLPVLPGKKSSVRFILLGPNSSWTSLNQFSKAGNRHYEFTVLMYILTMLGNKSDLLTA